MRGYCCLIIVSIILLISCSKPTTELTIPEETFVSILADAHLAESVLQSNYTSTKDSMSKVYYGQIYEIHGVTEAQFMENLRILETEPELMKEVFSKVMDKLSKLEADSKD